MIKRLTGIVILILLLVLGYSSMAWATHGGDFGDSRSGAAPEIWEGLCVGASLDLSRQSEVTCAKKARVLEAQNRAHAGELPNIGAGLCVGASLNVSRASVASCEKQFPQSASASSPPAPRMLSPKHRSQQRTVTVPPKQIAPYVALGDSVAAGVGLGDPTEQTGVCGRTFDAYPNIVAASRQIEVTNLACNGATVGTLFSHQLVNGSDIPPQLDSAFAQGTPKLMTITIGANDIHWDDFLRNCYHATCGTDSDEQTAGHMMAKLNRRLNVLLQKIEERSDGSPPEVIVTGYYNPLSENCAAVDARLTADEVAWLRTQTATLNQTLQTASAQHDFVTFAPVDFSGHDLCSDSSWVQSLEDPAPFHPTAEGRQAIARAIP